MSLRAKGETIFGGAENPTLLKLLTCGAHVLLRDGRWIQGDPTNFRLVIGAHDAELGRYSLTRDGLTDAHADPSWQDYEASPKFRAAPPPAALVAEIRYPEPVLCYIEDGFAYFTTRQLDKQWGDDWNDAPYEHNAEQPYSYTPTQNCAPYVIEKLAFESNLETPDYSSSGARFSVMQINAGAAPWLASPSWKNGPVITIPAGTTITDFKRLVREAGGTVYVAERRPRSA